LWYCDYDKNQIIEAIFSQPAEGWIVFASNQDGDNDIWAIRPDGTGLRELVNMPGEQSSPQWSPDSSRIVYVSGPVQIWVYDWFAGTNAKIYDAHDYQGQNLGSYSAYWPAWSPDGSKILYTEEFSYNDPHIMVINADGTGRAIVPVQSGFVTIPSWCPSGTAFVYNRRSGASYSEDLWIYDFTATGDIMNGINHRLTQGASSESTIKYYADWTPSGDIVFVWGHNLAIIDPGRSPNWAEPSNPNVTFLTNDASLPSPRYLWPSWSPDLSQIVYGYYTGISWDLWIMDASAGNRRQLTATSYDEASPDWGNPQPGMPTKPPVAEAGDDIVARANEQVTLDGSASYDPDGIIIKYTWKRLPDDVVLYSGEEPTYDTKALGRVEEVIELTVTDDSSATASDTLRIISRTTQDLKDQLAAMQSQIDQVQRQNQELRALVDRISSFPPIAQWLRRVAKLGDLNGDGQINMADLALLTKGWLR